MSPLTFRRQVVFGLLLPMIVANLVSAAIVDPTNTLSALLGAASGFGGTVGNNVDAAYSSFGNLFQGANSAIANPLLSSLRVNPIFNNGQVYNPTGGFAAPVVGPSTVGNNAALVGSRGGNIFQTTNSFVGSPYGPSIMFNPSVTFAG